jgi:hypothetical protein
MGTKPVSVARSNAGNTHIAGEMFVAAELAKRGYAIALTMGNAKAVDLFAEKGGRSICVQVKAIAHKRNVGWPLPFEKHKIIDGVLYVCVVLNELDEPPTYYVLPPEEVRTRGRWYNTRAILDLGKLKGGNFKDAWHLIEQALAGPAAIQAAV